MPTKSLVHGDYLFVMLVESASARGPNTWYRVLADKLTGLLSCDCHTWVYKGDVETDAQGHQTRLCKHTRFGRRLLALQGTAGTTPIQPVAGQAAVATTHPLVAATQQQWRGLGGVWGIEQRSALIGNEDYELVLLSLRPGNGGLATGLVAFSHRHHDRRDYASMVPGIALWGGYSLASQVAHLHGFTSVAPPTVHFKVPGRDGQGRRDGTRTQGAQQQVPFASRVGLADILRVGDHADLGDGLTPEVRAEHTLRLFLGETLYAQLDRDGYLDVSSVRFAESQRVYRLRRDPHRASERRVRIFEFGRHIHDYCIVRGQVGIPEADHFLTVFLGLLSDEQELLRVVTGSNIFGPDSESIGPERAPAIWKARPAALRA
jgi:hypothetical protein